MVLPGAVFGDALRGWYARASVFWTASLTENFSASILESLASGTPVVAAAAGGNVEQVVDDVCGCLTPANDAPEMARRTIALLRDDRLRARMSHAARDRALELSVDTATARLVTCLRELIAGHACTASGQAVRTSPGIDRGNPEPQRLDALR